MRKKILLIAFFCISIATYAGEKKITTSDGVELYVKVKGQGTPLLYIHGGPGSGSLWFEEFFGEFMEAHFTVVYLDQRGVGRSSSPKDGNYSMERMAQDFEEVRESLGFESWLTLGHSFGGILQMGYIQRFPLANKGMIMVNCTLNLPESLHESWAPKALEFLGETYTKNDSLPLPQLMNNLGSRLREKNIFWKMAYAHSENELIMNKTYEAIPNFNYDFGNAALLLDEYWENYKPSTSAVEQPVLFFYGTQDWMVGPEHYKGVEFPEAILWPGEVGHLPFQEGKEDLMASILEYKRKYSL